MSARFGNPNDNGLYDRCPTAHEEPHLPTHRSLQISLSTKAARIRRYQVARVPYDGALLAERFSIVPFMGYKVAHGAAPEFGQLLLRPPEWHHGCYCKVIWQVQQRFEVRFARGRKSSDGAATAFLARREQYVPDQWID